ncbi:MAG TPA: hypothetical protein PKW51_08455, partial [Methanoregulaceae archaeon]|nr:hypothetical protein [Methanoregulaceae archaeon]
VKEIKLKLILYNLMKNDGFIPFLTLRRISTRPLIYHFLRIRPSIPPSDGKNILLAPPRLVLTLC